MPRNEVDKANKSAALEGMESLVIRLIADDGPQTFTELLAKCREDMARLGKERQEEKPRAHSRVLGIKIDPMRLLDGTLQRLRRAGRIEPNGKKWSLVEMDRDVDRGCGRTSDR